jgi:hypothetical protein
VSKKNKKGLSDIDIISRYSNLELPIIALNKRPLTTYEALVLYLKDILDFNYHNISVILNRNERGIRIIYLRAKDKLQNISDKEFLGKYARLKIPLSQLNKRPLTTYEALVVFLKENSEFNYHDAANLLDRDERDIRKVYLRAKIKDVR